MNSETQEEAELKRILSALLNSSIDPGDAKHLETLLKNDPLRISLYLQITELDVLLSAETSLAFEGGAESTDSLIVPDAKLHKSLAFAGEVETMEKSDSGTPLTESRATRMLTAFPGRLRSARFVAALLVSAISILGFLGWWASNYEPQVAVILNESALYKGLGPAPSTGDSLDIGRTIQLTAGRLGLRTRSGVKLVVEGPAVLTPLANGDFDLQLGKVRVRVSEEGKGFAIHSGDATVTDLGTEFGVYVTESGLIETEVYDGRVRLAIAENGDEKMLEFPAGWVGVAHAGPPLKLEASEIGSRRSELSWWSPSQQSVSRTLAARPELYFCFDHPAGKEAKSIVNSELYSLTLAGNAKWNSGGPINSMGEAGNSLRLFGDGYGEIPIGFARIQQSGQFTFSLWLRLTKSNDQNVFLTTNHLGPDQRIGSHLRIRSDGILEHHLSTPGSEWGANPPPQIQASSNPVGLRSWRHIVVSAATSGQMMLYVDGVLVAEPMDVAGIISGAYPRILLGSGSSKLDFGPLSGMIEEFALFGRQLSSEEVASLHQTSRKCFEVLR